MASSLPLVTTTTSVSRQQQRYPPPATGKRRLFVRLISDVHFTPVITAGSRSTSISAAAEEVLNSLLLLGSGSGSGSGGANDKKSEGGGGSAIASSSRSSSPEYRQTVLVLAGDIGDPASDPYRRLLVAARAAYESVILVPGNHEYYTDGERDMGVVKEYLGRLARDTGIILLDNSDVVLHGLRFVGSTCWPLVPEEQYKVLKREGYGLVTRISKDSHRLDPSDFKRLHDTDVAYLQETLRNSREPCVVVTHYPPSHMMIDDKFEHAPHIALHYNAGLIERVAKTQGATPLWLCGHCHTSKRFWTHGMNTLLAANCVEGGQYDPDFIVELKAP